MKANFKIILAVSILALASYAVHAEEVTISTYYPSPYGSYENLDTTGNTNLATVDGAVGIGTTSPSAGSKLDVVMNNNNSNIVTINNPYVGVSASSMLMINASNGGLTLAHLSGSYGGSGMYSPGSAYLSAANPGGLSLGTVAGGAPLKLYTGCPTDFCERLRITPAGQVGIGTLNPNPAFLLHVAGRTANTTGVWTNLSDGTLKQNVMDLNGGLNKIEKLRPVTFEWKNAGVMGREKGAHMGFVAQDVEKVLPEWVKTDSDGYKWLQKEGVEALLVQAIQELEERNAALEKRVKSLEAK